MPLYMSNEEMTWVTDLGNCLPKASLGNQLGVIKLGSG